MSSQAPETAASLRSRIAELEQQLALSDEGVSKLAQRCLALEQELQPYLSAHAKQEVHINTAMVQLKLFFDRGFGFSEQDSLLAPTAAYQESTHSVAAVFELPYDACALRLDPGELPCYIKDLTLSDDRLTCTPLNGVGLSDAETLFLHIDPNYRVEGLSRFPAGMKLLISYTYYPVQKLAGDPLFDAVLRGLNQTRQQLADGQNQLALQQTRISELEQQLAACDQERQRYAQMLEQTQSSACWKLTAPLRRIAAIFHRG